LSKFHTKNIKILTSLKKFFKLTQVCPQFPTTSCVIIAVKCDRNSLNIPYISKLEQRIINEMKNLIQSFKVNDLPATALQIFLLFDLNKNVELWKML
jgi:hypothetical protein